MRLAEALISRADMQKRLAQLQARIIENARVQEGDQPAEDPTKLIAEFEELLQSLVSLISRINQTNLSVVLPSGQSLTDAIAVRDGYKIQAAMYRAVADAGIGKQARVTRSEVKFVATVKVGGLREDADRVSRLHRELDSAIQEANWKYDLVG